MNAAKPISMKGPMTGASRGCLLTIGFVFTLAGVIAFCAITLLPLWRSIQARSWSTAEATITHSAVDVNADSDGDTYRPDIHFAFNVDGNQWTSKTYSFSSVSTSARGWVDQAVEKYSVGSKHACYYNPAKPADAVLERTFPMSSLFGLFTLLFVAAGVFMIVAGFSRETANAGSTGKLAEGKPAVSQFTSPGDGSERSYPWFGFEGPQRLEPKMSRMAKLIGIGIFALIWNSITGVGLYVGFSEGSIVMILFLSIFAIVGAIVLFALVYQFLAMFNPIVEIALSNGTIPAGQEVDIAWEINGNPNRIRELVVEITGTEKATYTRGTSTHTADNIFMKLPVMQTGDREAMRFGSVAIRMPADSIPSFNAAKNKIEWAIIVRGSIPFWPDISESYPFFVKPDSMEDSANA